MARCDMHVIHDGKVIGFGLWNGTIDVVTFPRWVNTKEELRTLWDVTEYGEWPEDCDCEPVKGILWINYAGGLWWVAPLCLKHQHILGNRAHESKEYFTQKEHEKNPPEPPEGIGFGYGQWEREQNPTVYSFVTDGYPPGIDTSLAGWDPAKERR